MIGSFLAQAAQSPTRQRSLRRLVIAHVITVTTLSLYCLYSPGTGSFLTLGYVALMMGIVEGAVMIGWRLTQIPKSQALEFLLVSPLRPRWVLINEAVIGFLLLGFITLSGLPILAVVAGVGMIHPVDLLFLTWFPWTWGAITGLLLTTSAYESRPVRRWGERFFMLMILFYLVVGIMAGEKLRSWLLSMPDVLGRNVYYALIALREYNPFGVTRHWIVDGASYAWERAISVQMVSFGILILFLWRASSRLQAHFHERHYQRIDSDRKDQVDRIRNQPLRWWAVRRVTQYSGRINLYLACGFCLLYSFYLLAGSHWPPWMGRNIFLMCDRVMGPEGLGTALIVLSAVPAAYQYGLWDSNSQDRVRRLELLLLTDLEARDYWNAAAAAAWHRGKGYFFIALFLWLSAGIGGRLALLPLLAMLATSALLWGLYFVLGFRAFSRGQQANSLAMILTVAVPVATIVLYRMQWPLLAAFLPPGAVYGSARTSSWIWCSGAILMGAFTLILTRRALRDCVGDLQSWCNRNHGSKVVV